MDIEADVGSAADPAQIVQITPHAGGGVVDFARGLQAAWEDAGVASQVLPLAEDDVRHVPLAERLQRLSPASRASCAVLLHFSGYGYAKRGLCGWLVDAIRAARREMPGRLRLVSFVHEIAASGPPWRSAFWTAAGQSRIAAALALESDLLWTNTAHHAAWLRHRVGATRPLRVAPVFSTIGECTRPRPFVERQPALIVFGSASTRQRAFSSLAAHAPLLHRLAIDSIIEVGSGAPSAAAASLPRREFFGMLGEAELGRLLASSRFGLLDYGQVHLGKSTVFAAYASFGCVAINTSAEMATVPVDGIAAGVHFVAAHRPGRDLSDAALQAVARAAHGWYVPHQRRTQAQAFLRTLRVAKSGPLAGNGRANDVLSQVLP